MNITFQIDDCKQRKYRGRHNNLKLNNLNKFLGKRLKDGILGCSLICIYLYYSLSLSHNGITGSHEQSSHMDKEKTGKVNSQSHKLFKLHNLGRRGGSGKREKDTQTLRNPEFIYLFSLILTSFLEQTYSIGKVIFCLE